MYSVSIKPVQSRVRWGTKMLWLKKTISAPKIHPIFDSCTSAFIIFSQLAMLIFTFFLRGKDELIIFLIMLAF